MSTESAPPEPVPGPWVLILGMHRSNTSALTGALAAMGLALPEASDLVVGQPDNPNHYESTSLIAFNDELLELLGGRWDLPPELETGWEATPAVRDLAGGARDALARTFPEPGTKVWKDPRLCLLLPFWQPAVAGPLAVVFIWRSPAEVADSLRRRGGSTIPHGLALWDLYNRAALTAMEGLPVYVLDSDTLIDAPHATCSDLAAWLDAAGIAPGGAAGWDVDRATATIDPALTHHWRPGHDDVLPSQLALVDHLRSLGGPHAAFSGGTPGAPSTWSTDSLAERRKRATLGRGNKLLSDAHEELIASYHELVAVAEERLTVVLALQDAVPGLKAEVAHLRGQLDRAAAEAADWKARAERAGDELAELRTSNSWKITAPLRAATTAVDRWTRPGR